MMENKNKYKIIKDAVAEVVNVSSSLFDTTVEMFKQYGNIELTDEQLAMFFAVCAVETGKYRVFEENLNYSSMRLLAVFPYYFTSILAKRCAYNPQRIANIVYGYRMGNVEPNDGYLYRGRGILQITGKEAYERFGKFVGDATIVDNPDKVATDEKLQVLSAVWFWLYRNVYKESKVSAVTKIVNGGYNGLELRTKYYNKIIEYVREQEKA